MTECVEWEAWYNKMPGTDDPELHVSGLCKLESSTIEVTLEPGNEGSVDEPDLFVLECTIERPGFGDTQYVEKPISWQDDVGPDIKRVRIQGDAHAEVEVRDAV